MAMVRQKKRKIALLAAAAVLLALAIGCGAYVGDYYRADVSALAAMAETENVTVEVQAGRTVFSSENPIAGLIFYPGGKVEYTAYAPLMLALAEQDILCILLEMPLNLAVLDMDAAEGIPEQFPEVEHWYVSGHSLGGSMAASYLAEHPEDFDGLILLASYSTADLTETNLQVLSLYGDRDGVLNMEKYEEYRPNLPETTVETVIEGGNHAGFGSYGPQEGDGEAGISSQEQIAFTAAQILAFLAEAAE